MRLLISSNSVCYCGKINELRELLQTWSGTNITLKEFITKSLQ